MMHDYSVVPNQGENGWVVKIQNTAPSGTYSSRSEAIALAKNQPRKTNPAGCLFRILSLE
ncbi:DUF2188 domain-containing protein [Fictibacillus terranigra]|uniref:DUF2188 domain-containing protein n=1 Tax=Fictibacillus terranigra TaxID=3058424 RepID=A0ABT8EB88_9BACL|nr:DUF2188 domain-containing protein [Fictibacillus sp. CENA-BCM004]MDN4075155.1 DUF2188 domain-containing protein [Fictibacillus sp. CENA-BCM004]